MPGSMCNGEMSKRIYVSKMNGLNIAELARKQMVKYDYGMNRNNELFQVEKVKKARMTI